MNGFVNTPQMTEAQAKSALALFMALQRSHAVDHMEVDILDSKSVVIRISQLALHTGCYFKIILDTNGNPINKE